MKNPDKPVDDPDKPVISLKNPVSDLLSLVMDDDDFDSFKNVIFTTKSMG